MSYEVFGEPDDDDWSERASEAGWVSEDVVEELRALMKFVDMGDPRPGNKSDAALILIEHALSPPPADKPEDPHVTWAKALLGL